MSSEIEVFRPHPWGGQGAGAPESSNLPEWSRADVRDAARALRGRWPMSTEQRRRVMETLFLIATNPQACGVREAVTAGRALIDADRLNFEDEARRAAQPELVQENGRTRIRFEDLSDEDLDRFIDETL